MNIERTKSQAHSRLNINLSNEINDLFQKSPYHELRHVRSAVADKTITLVGSLHSFFLKQVAQEAIRKVAGDCLVVNSIKVEDGYAAKFSSAGT